MKTYAITITNKQTGEVATVHRDVTIKHPEWVHEQCGTHNESELQACLDALNVSDWYDKEGKHLGPDVCGISMKFSRIH